MDNIHKPYFFKLSREEQKSALEALIFASDDPVTTGIMRKILLETKMDYTKFADEPDPEDKRTGIEDELPENYFEELIDEINADLTESGRPFEIVYNASGYQFATRQEFGEIIHNLIRTRAKKRLTQASLEVLSIVSYRQPVTKPEIDQIRGVKSSEVLNTLVDKNLVKIVGRSDALGRPLLYGTTTEFLRTFGLNSLQDLPRLRELEELMEDDEFNKRRDQITLHVDDGDMEKLRETVKTQNILDTEKIDEEIQKLEENGSDIEEN